MYTVSHCLHLRLTYNLTKIMFIYIVLCSTDDRMFIIAVAVGAVIAVVVITAVIGVIIWRVLSNRSAAERPPASETPAPAAEPAVVSSPPVTFFSKPAVHARSIQPPLHSRAYGNYYNNGYYDNERPAHGHRQYQSKLNVQPGQFSSRF